jgi:hypothetical protein
MSIEKSTPNKAAKREKALFRKIQTAFAEYVHVRSEFIWKTIK